MNASENQPLKYIMWLYKTQPCKEYEEKKVCAFGKHCFKYHKPIDRRRVVFYSDKKKRWTYSIENCSKSKSHEHMQTKHIEKTKKRCRKSHNDIERQYHPMMYKTQKCNQYTYGCEAGLMCPNYHNDRERRYVVDPPAIKTPMEDGIQPLDDPTPHSILEYLSRKTRHLPDTSAMYNHATHTRNTGSPREHNAERLDAQKAEEGSPNLHSPELESDIRESQTSFNSSSPPTPPKGPRYHSPPPPIVRETHMKSPSPMKSRAKTPTPPPKRAVEQPPVSVPAPRPYKPKRNSPLKSPPPVRPAKPAMSHQIEEKESSEEIKVIPKLAIDEELFLLISTFKTQECPNLENCPAPEQCPYWHDMDDWRRNGTQKQYLARPCPDSFTVHEKSTFVHGKCKNGSDCPFSHNFYEMWFHPQAFRTKACRYWEMFGACPWREHQIRLSKKDKETLPITNTCSFYHRDGEKLSKEDRQAIQERIAALQEEYQNDPDTLENGKASEKEEKANRVLEPDELPQRRRYHGGY